MEAVLSQHPGVAGCVVVGLPDVRLTEMVVACIRIKDNWKWPDNNTAHWTETKELLLSTEILRRHCRDKNLTGYCYLLFYIIFVGCMAFECWYILIPSSSLFFSLIISLFFFHRFKIPKIFTLWRKPFPLASTGKLRRYEVQREVLSHMQSILPSHL